jgi:hypothetical protein
MVVIALVVPVMLLFMLFGLDAFENFLFRPPSAPPPGNTVSCPSSALRIGSTAGPPIVDADIDARLALTPWVNSESPLPAAERCDP